MNRNLLAVLATATLFWSGPGLSDGGATSLNWSPPPAKPADADVHCKTLKAPRVSSRQRPAYPPELRKAHVEGRVIVEYHVGVDGRVLGVRVVDSSEPRLVPPALEAARRTSFKPAQCDGALIASLLQDAFTYRLQ